MKFLIVSVLIWSGFLSDLPRVEALTVSNLVDRTRDYLRDTSSDSSRQRFTNTVLIRFFQDCQEDIINRTWMMEGRTNVSLVSGTREYSLPSDYLKPTRVRFNNKALKEVTIEGFLDDEGRDWTVVTGTPTVYYIRRSTLPYIGFYPAPNFSSGSTVEIDYVRAPVELTAIGDTPFTANSTDLQLYHRVLPYCAAEKGWLINGRGDIAVYYHQLYENEMLRVKETLGTMPNYRPGFQGRKN